MVEEFWQEKMRKLLRLKGVTTMEHNSEIAGKSLLG
jgi:hypothetical protein